MIFKNINCLIIKQKGRLQLRCAWLRVARKSLILLGATSVRQSVARVRLFCKLLILNNKKSASVMRQSPIYKYI